MDNYRQPQMNIRVYLNIPYSDKDYAKNLGCRWDPERKSWYCIDSDKGKSNVSECTEIWSDPEPYKIIDNEIHLISDIPDENRGYTN